MVLNSWKEIAGYVGRGVRTVQRWESDLGMPVRRPRAKSRSAVVAMSDEIDRWLRSAPTAEPSQNRAPLTCETVQKLRQTLLLHQDLRVQYRELRNQNAVMLDELRHQLMQLRNVVKAVKLGAKLSQASERAEGASMAAEASWLWKEPILEAAGAFASPLLREPPMPPDRRPLSKSKPETRN